METIKINESDLKKIVFESVKKVLKEGAVDGYVNADELADFCRENDFLYIYNFPFGGLKISCANSSEIQEEIINDIYDAAFLKETHEVDYLLQNRIERGDLENFKVIKLCDIPNEKDYYIVWEQI